MGGLVALTKAHHTPRYTPILAHTTAILFLATPHRGSLDAAFLANIATISNLSLSSTGVSRFKGRIRDDLIKGLRRDDEVVMGIARGFVPLTGRMRFYSFVEEVGTVGLGRRVGDFLFLFFYSTQLSSTQVKWNEYD
ncbi:hypothetical protein HYALB_00011756 [Hymenoscyphus albidus]|uniref:Uncharacterized protein n=1 Tax=Hymenoscyphus albidus TaxID=595503 RepID=A0A9N9Q3T3_9HELO|nr:hypothetical protein HYALB_00011756 [Hymenoscyphus albidus]